MEQFVCLADLPELAPAGGPSSNASEIVLAKLGRFKHRRYGRFQVTPEMFDRFIENFDRQGGRIPIDVDHAPEKGVKEKPTEAYGWITELRVADGQLFATVEWTDLGADAIRSKRYLFISPTWSLNFEDEQGEKVGPTLIGAGLTNRPFFQLPVLSLSQTFSVDDADADQLEDGAFEPDSFDKHGKDGKKADEPPKDPGFEQLHPRGGGGLFIATGSSHDQAVKNVQDAVGAKRDGEFGALTDKAVRAYQQKHGLQVDGVVGRQTAMALLGHEQKAKDANVGQLTDDQLKKLAHTPARTHDDTPGDDEVDDETFERIGSKKLSARLKGKVDDPDAVAAAIGRKKYGAKKMRDAAAAGTTLGDDIADDELMGLAKGCGYAPKAMDDAPAGTSEIGVEGSPDSRAAMDRDTLIAIFGLESDATDEQIEEAAKAAAARPDAPQPHDQVPPAGSPLQDIARLFGVDAEQADQVYAAVRQAKETADAGQQSAERLADTLFASAFDKAVDDGRATPAMRDGLHAYFSQDQEGALKHIKTLQPIVNTTARGRSGHGAGDAPEGVDQESFELDAQITRYMSEHGCDYVAAFTAVIAEAH